MVISYFLYLLNLNFISINKGLLSTAVEISFINKYEMILHLKQVLS